jgi:hypothetical protein
VEDAMTTAKQADDEQVRKPVCVMTRLSPHRCRADASLHYRKAGERERTLAASFN